MENQGQRKAKPEAVTKIGEFGLIQIRLVRI